MENGESLNETFYILASGKLQRPVRGNTLGMSFRI